MNETDAWDITLLDWPSETIHWIDQSAKGYRKRRKVCCGCHLLSVGVGLTGGACMVHAWERMERAVPRTQPAIPAKRRWHQADAGGDISAGGIDSLRAPRIRYMAGRISLIREISHLHPFVAARWYRPTATAYGPYASGDFRRPTRPLQWGTMFSCRIFILEHRSCSAAGTEAVVPVLAHYMVANLTCTLQST